MKKLAAIWQKILKVESVGTREDFFQLGGDSLALALMMAEVDVEFGSDDNAEFLSSPDIETFVGFLMRSPGRRTKHPHLSRSSRMARAFRFSAFPGRAKIRTIFLT